MSIKTHVLALCFILFAPLSAYAQLNLTVAGEETPTSQPWTKPASFSYTFNQDGEDSYAVHAAVTSSFLQLSPISAVRGNLLWHRTNQTSREQDNTKVGMSLFRIFGHNSDPTSNDMFSVHSTFGIAYNRTGVFVTKPPTICASTPNLPQCDTQYKESIRATLTATPVHRRWYRLCAEGMSFGCSFSPSASLVYDEMLDNVVNPATGVTVNGAVAAGQIAANVSLSDRLVNPRLRLTASAQLIERLSASDTRADLFPQSSELYTASLEYIFYAAKSGSPPESEGDNAPWSLSFGVDYRHGADPLRGRAEQETITVGLRFRMK